MIKLSQYAKQNGLSYTTAYRYFNAGLIKGVKMPTGTILIESFDPVKVEEFGGKRVVLYARVSSSENKSNLDSQMERLRNFASAKGYTVVQEVKEIGSGINDKRKLLEKVLSENEGWDKIVVEHKDRFARFGINHTEVLLAKQHKEIEIINETEGGEDLMQDFISIITSFCAKIYGQRRSRRKTEKIIAQLGEEEEK